MKIYILINAAIVHNMHIQIDTVAMVARWKIQKICIDFEKADILDFDAFQSHSSLVCGIKMTEVSYETLQLFYTAHKYRWYGNKFPKENNKISYFLKNT
jgi:hypothetical protein